MLFFPLSTKESFTIYLSHEISKIFLMKILLAGHSVVDFIHEGEKIRNQPGGLYYTAAALAHWKNQDDLISPVTLVSENSYNFFSAVFDKLDKKFLQFVSEVPTIHLTIHPDKEREERYENISRAVEIPFQYLNYYNGILINMITGFEFDLSTFQTLRKNFTGLIYFDVHSLARGMDANMKREFRPIEKFSQWAECIDILQANENEFLTLSSKSNSMYEIAKELIEHGIKIILITKGEKGVRCFMKRRNEVESIFIPAIKINCVNKVGCGDVFGAVFFYNYLSTQNLQSSLRVANCAGGIVTSYPSHSSLENLKKDVNRKLSE